MKLWEADEAVLDFIAGRGSYRGWGTGIRTYPQLTDDDGQVQLHAACVRLEAAGKVRRVTDEPALVVWALAEAS